MPRQITIDVPDDLYEPMCREAAKAGQTLPEWVLAQLRSEVLSPEDIRAALERVLAHSAEPLPAAGAAQSTGPVSTERRAS
jgi:hypothetical protein